MNINYFVWPWAGPGRSRVYTKFVLFSCRVTDIRHFQHEGEGPCGGTVNLREHLLTALMVKCKSMSFRGADHSEHWWPDLGGGAALRAGGQQEDLVHVRHLPGAQPAGACVRPRHRHRQEEEEEEEEQEEKQACWRWWEWGGVFRGQHGQEQIEGKLKHFSWSWKRIARQSHLGQIILFIIYISLL